MSQSLKIGPDCFIGNAVEVHARLLNSLRTNEELLVDLSTVERIDTAGIQLLLAAEREAACLGVRLSFSLPERLTALNVSLGIVKH